MENIIPVTRGESNKTVDDCINEMPDKQPKKEEVRFFDAKTYKKEQIPEWRLKILYTLAIFASILIIWFVISIFLPSSKDDIFIRGVKNVKKADANLDTLLLEVKNNARDIDAAYSDIQKNGNGARFYSKYNIQAGSGSIIITYSNYENQAKTQETDTGTGN